MSPFARIAWVALLSFMTLHAFFTLKEQLFVRNNAGIPQLGYENHHLLEELHTNELREEDVAVSFSSAAKSHCGGSPKIEFEGYYDEELWPHFTCSDHQIDSINGQFEALVQRNLLSVKESIEEFDRVGKSAFQWVRFSKVGGTTIQVKFFDKRQFSTFWNTSPLHKAKEKTTWRSTFSSYNTCFYCEKKGNTTVFSEEGARYCRQSDRIQCFDRSALSNAGLLDVEPSVYDHIPYRDGQRSVLRPSALLLLLFREPRARLISAWRWRWEMNPVVRVGDPVVHRVTGCKRTTMKTLNITLADYLRMCTRCSNNQYVAMLDPQTHNVTVALQRLTHEKALIGILERFEETLNLFADVLRLRSRLHANLIELALSDHQSSSRRVQHDSGASVRAQFDEETELLIEEHVRYDRIIYEHALKLFDRQVGALRGV